MDPKLLELLAEFEQLADDLRRMQQVETPNMSEELASFTTCPQCGRQSVQDGVCLSGAGCKEVA